MTDLQTRFTTEALVIKEMNVGESDRLVTLFTREYGILKAFASGAKNIKSKKGTATSLLTYSSFTVLNKKGTLRIYEATPIAQFFSMGSDISVLALSQYFCELAMAFGEEGEADPQLLRVFLNSLYFLTKKKRYPALIKAITELRVASVSGYTPNLVACEGCGEFEADVMYFNINDGSLACEGCRREGKYIPVSRTELSAMRHIVYSEIEKLYSFEIPNEAADRLSVITEKYLTEQTDYRFATLDFYNDYRMPKC